MSLSATAVGDPLDTEPDDRLPPEQRRLIAGLIQRGMPELVEAHLAHHPRMHRVYVARAYAKAGIDEKDPTLRERFFVKAAEAYRSVLKLASDADWFRGERRRVDIAAWYLEYADMILRGWIAPDLDRYESSSGLDFNRNRLTKRIREARAAYLRAGPLLKELDVDLRTNEERFLLLGLAERISDLLPRQELNSAWSALYLAMVIEPDDPERAQLLSDALVAFDAAAASARDPERKYTALLGAGMALRENRRFDEAMSVFEKVLVSTASRSLAARASYEKGRLLIAVRQFDRARRELDRLGSQSTKRLRGADTGAIFYIRLAPLIHAYTYLLEARLPRAPAETLRKKAKQELLELYERGGAWPRLVRVYLDALAGKKRDLDQLSEAELRVAAADLMSNRQYEEAVRIWRLLSNREEAGPRRHEARFNLGVCYFQTHDLRSAAETFLTEARLAPPKSIASKVYVYAYRCWRQVAADRSSTDDYKKLAEAAALLASNLPSHPLADEARWVGALALEESGDYTDAIRAYRRISANSPNHWSARRNIARCAQRRYEALPEKTSRAQRAALADEAVDAWLKLVDALSSLDGSKKTGAQKRRATPAPTPASNAEMRRRWMNEAKLAAAALLVSEDLRAYDRCRDLLAETPESARVLGLRIRCLQGLGRIEEANQAVEDFLKKGPAKELGSVLLGLAAEMEAEIKRLETAGRKAEARRMANETVPTLRYLLEWIRSRPDQRRHVPIVQFSLVRTLIQAGRARDAVRQLEALMEEDPNNGRYVRRAAILHEDLAAKAVGAQRVIELNRAESLWARLLKDPTLRTTAPARYWEARCHWYRHQLRHGRAAEVIRGIETEKAWQPDLGGAPWQGRLLELVEEARSALRESPPLESESSPIRTEAVS